MADLQEKLKASLPETIGDLKVTNTNTIDGYKFILDSKNTWLGIRFSGTEPVVRVYVESASQENIDKILAAVEKDFNLT
jgi:phosphomannomutase